MATLSVIQALQFKIEASNMFRAPNPLGQFITGQSSITRNAMAAMGGLLSGKVNDADGKLPHHILS